MEVDEIISFLVTLYVLWIFLRGLFNSRSEQPRTQEQTLDEHHEPEPPRTGWEPWQPEPPRRSTPVLPLPTAPPVHERPPSLSTIRASEALDPQAPTEAALGTWEDALEAASQRQPRQAAPRLMSPGTVRSGRSRAQALLGSRRDLLRGIVAHEILGPPVSERS